MTSRYSYQTTISATPSDIWQLLTQQNFVKQYLPEVKRKPSDIRSTAPYRYHQNTDNILPAYTVVEKTISWDNISHALTLTRKDLKANIDSVTIVLIAEAGDTKVMIEVIYQPKVDSKLLLTHASVRNLFSHKLDVFKQDIESETKITNCLITYV